MFLDSNIKKLLFGQLRGGCKNGVGETNTALQILQMRIIQYFVVIFNKVFLR